MQLPRKVDLLTLGPVAWYRNVRALVARDEVQLVSIVGDKDLLSQWFYRGESIRIANLAHLGYWSNRQVREVAASWLLNKISV